MAPHERDHDNQSDETATVAPSTPSVTTSSVTTAPVGRRKSLNSLAFATGPVCVMEADPAAEENSAERVVVVKEPDADASSALALSASSSSSSSSAAAAAGGERRRKRDVVRQISMRLYLKGKDIAEDVMRNVALQRMEDAENVCAAKDSSLEHEIPPSRKTRKHLWLPKTQDDSVLLQGSAKGSHHEINEFFVSRVTDPTSYFFRFRYDDHRHLTPQKAEVQLVDIAWLKAHEEIVSLERVSGLKKATLSWDAYTEPLLVDIKTGAILDGHHRYTVGVQLRLQQLPAVLVDYLGDDSITVDVWPGCGRSQLSKEEVIAMALSPGVFPPKTSRHRFTESLPPISIPLSVLRQPPAPLAPSVLPTTLAPSTPSAAPAAVGAAPSVSEPAASGEAPASRLRQVSIELICGAQSLATSVTKSLFRSRLRKIDGAATQLDMIRRPAVDARSLFHAVREHDPSSSFCQQRAATFEDLLSSDAAARQKFYLTRICDPTSYFFKYHFDAPPKRSPRKARVQLAALAWLKAHEHVVSWERVDGLRHATTRWDAYLEPLLVDAATGAILDGHHRFHVGRQLGLASVPVVLVDYLGDDSITVDVWPDCGRDSLTKEEVIAMSLSDGLFPPKTSRHKFSDDLPPIKVPLARLREPLAGNTCDL